MARVSVSDVLSRARSYEKRGQFNSARMQYEKILKAFPGNQVAQKALGDLTARVRHRAPLQRDLDRLGALYSQGNFRELRKHTEVLLQEYPASFLLWNIFGAAQQGLGNSEQAEVAYLRAVSLNPRNADALVNLGNMQRELGKLEEAADSYSRALVLNPKLVEAHNNLGNVLRGQEKLAEAITRYRFALNLQPDNAEVHNNMGMVYYEQEEFAESVNSCLRAVEIDPEMALGYFNLGKALDREGDHEAAIISIRRALEIQPDFVDAKVQLADTLLSNGDATEAAALIRQLHKDGFSTISILDKASRLPSELIDFDVVEELDRLTEETAGNEDASGKKREFTRAQAHHQAQRYEEAFKHLQSANRSRHESMLLRLKQSQERECEGLKYHQELEPAKPISKPDSPVALFILGPSRSGKSTMEKLVSRLPGVYRGYERHGYQAALKRAMKSNDATRKLSFESLPPIYFSQLSESLEEHLSEEARSAKVITHTAPGVIWHGSHLARLIPNCRFLFVRRDIEDLVFRIYMKNYRDGTNTYSYDLSTIREHIDRYYQMMDLMAEKFPEIVEFIDYEDMVKDPAAALKIAMQMCGLDGPVPDLPEIGNDMGCSGPYREMMR